MQLLQREFTGVIMDPAENEKWSVWKLVGLGEHGLLVILSIVMLALIALGMLDLIVTLGRDIVDPPGVMRLDISEMLSAIGSLLMILVGLELLETLRAYQADHAIRVDMVLAVALTAMARKIILLIGKEPTVETMLGVGALIVSLGVTFFLVARSRSTS
jgi:uncharacterized membrane protein (DUF373 family)